MLLVSFHLHQTLAVLQFTASRFAVLRPGLLSFNDTLRVKVDEVVKLYCLNRLLGAEPTPAIAVDSCKVDSCKSAGLGDAINIPFPQGCEVEGEVTASVRLRDDRIVDGTRLYDFARCD